MIFSCENGSKIHFVVKWYYYIYAEMVFFKKYIVMHCFVVFCFLISFFTLEVIRDVIGVHMEELSNHWQEENRLDNAEMCEGGKSKSSGRYITVDIQTFMRDLLFLCGQQQPGGL